MPPRHRRRVPDSVVDGPPIHHREGEGQELDATVEATAYFVVAEALTNVVRYSGAAGARVTVREDGDTLLVEVSDDGRGGADPAAGSGLRGLDDRVSAIGGRLSVTSPAGGGTTVRAELPVHVSAEIAAPATDGTLSDDALASGSLAVRAVPAAPAAEERTRVGAVSPLVLILALTGGLAVLAVGAGVLGSQAYPVDGRAETFARPFVFQVPSNSQILVDAKSPDLHVLSAQPAGFQGISIWSVGDVLTDNCDWNLDTPTTSRAPGRRWAARLPPIGSAPAGRGPRNAHRRRPAGPPRRPQRRGRRHAVR